VVSLLAVTLPLFPTNALVFSYVYILVSKLKRRHPYAMPHSFRNKAKKILNNATAQILEPKKRLRRHF